MDPRTKHHILKILYDIHSLQVKQMVDRFSISSISV
jgi:hypothetical protein